jgi:hypothetical protein
MHILTWEYAQKKAPFFTLSLDCELTYPFDENATTLTYYLQSRLLACLDQVNRLARYLLKRYIVNSLVPDKKGEARKTLAFCRSLAPTCVRSFCP